VPALPAAWIRAGRAGDGANGSRTTWTFNTDGVERCILADWSDSHPLIRVFIRLCENLGLGLGTAVVKSLFLDQALLRADVDLGRGGGAGSLGMAVCSPASVHFRLIPFPSSSSLFLFLSRCPRMIFPFGYLRDLFSSRNSDDNMTS
jgi:hypothetical protein